MQLQTLHCIWLCEPLVLLCQRYAAACPKELDAWMTRLSYSHNSEETEGAAAAWAKVYLESRLRGDLGLPWQGQTALEMPYCPRRYCPACVPRLITHCSKKPQMLNGFELQSCESGFAMSSKGYQATPEDCTEFRTVSEELTRTTTLSMHVTTTPATLQLTKLPVPLKDIDSSKHERAKDTSEHAVSIHSMKTARI